MIDYINSIFSGKIENNNLGNKLEEILIELNEKLWGRYRKYQRRDKKIIKKN